MIMASLTIRNLPDNVHRALRVKAARNGNSAEAEVRAILKQSVTPEGRAKLGIMLFELGREINITDEEVTIINQVRDRNPAGDVSFE